MTKRGKMAKVFSRSGIFILMLITGVSLKGGKEDFHEASTNQKNPTDESNEWVDSVFQTLSLKEKIGQLFMVAAYSNKGERHKQNITQLIQEYHIGGLIFFQGSPTKQAKLTNYYQQQANVPLLIAMDAEWGLSMRLDSTMAFPKQMTLGAIPNDSLVYDMGSAIAEQCRRLGVHINFAPVVDINNNPGNPVIHMRSFGENKKKVAQKSKAYLNGLQENKVIGVGKHFPGHGDTDQDSHLSLPEIPHSKKRLENLELYPFRQIIKANTAGIMAAHLSVPAYESRENLPSSLSPNIIKKLLREKMGYDGLVFTDALNMKGVTNHFPVGEIEKRALKAGNDVLLFSKNIPTAVKTIRKAIEQGEIKKARLNKSVKRILQAKYRAGLDQFKPVKEKGLIDDLNQKKHQFLKNRLVEKALTALKNKANILPIEELALKDYAAVSIGAEKNNPFHQKLKQYTDITSFSLPKNPSKMDFSVLRQKLMDFDKVILSLHNLNEYDVDDFGLSNQTIDYINRLAEGTKNIMVNFGSPYALKFLNHNEGLLQAYEDGKVFQKKVGEGIFGALEINGRLPVSVKNKFNEGAGLKIEPINRLSYNLPESVGISSGVLNDKIDSLAQRAIDKEATPGCQILVAKEGNVIYHKAFGYHTYDKKRPVILRDKYDIASVNKIAATMLAVMRLHDIGRININDSIGQYLTENIDSLKSDLKIKEILTHQAGLVAWIPFYKYTLNKQGFCDSNYCYNPNSFYSVKVAQGLHLQEDYQDSIWQRITQSDVKGRGNYRYSDLGFFYMKKLVEQLIQVPFEKYLYRNFYEPIGMNQTRFLPRQHFALKHIIPTEKDDYFRHQLIHGYVHDPAAAMLGGIAGHAGLFSNSNDMAKLMQMLLNAGSYGGKRYFSWPTIKKFTSKQYEDNRKGLGFDKPELRPDKISPTSDLASASTFGHTGFTGTCVWADPRHDLVYVFLSNRVHPTRKNRKLIKMDVRTDIQSAIYESFLSEQIIKKRRSARN